MAEEAPYAHPKRVVLQTRVERWRAKLQKDSRLRRLYDRAALPVDEPTEFRVDAHTLASQLMPKDGDPAARAARAADILQEAQGIFQQAEDRAAGATDRATTLQEAVGIAATLLIAGAGLIVGQSALQGLGWVIAFALLLLGATVTLVMSGLQALAAASTIHVWYRPTAGDIVKRSQLPEAVARTRLAAETLIDYGYNTKVAGWKVAHLNASAWWYRIALAFIVSIAMLVGIYALFGTNHGSKPTPASQAHASVLAPHLAHLSANVSRTGPTVTVVLSEARGAQGAVSVAARQGNVSARVSQRGQRFTFAARRHGRWTITIRFTGRSGWKSQIITRTVAV